MKLGRVFLGAVLAVALLSLLVYLFGNTRLDVQGSGRGGLSVATELPNATCRKTFTAEFPFVRLGCEKAQPDGTGSRPSAQP